MLINNRRLLIIPLVIALAVLLYIGCLANEVRVNGLTLILPMQSNQRGVSLSQLEELDESLLLAYGITETAMAQALNSNFDVTLHYTNYLYPFVTEYTMAAGGFFGENKQSQKSKTAVLNEQAAFKIFGSADVLGGDIKIGSIKYEIVGVIRDGQDENMNIYLPVTLTVKQPNSFILRTGGAGEFSHAVNELKQAGISSANYNFENLGVLSKRVAAKAVFVAGLIACMAGIFLLKRCISGLREQIKAVRNSLQPARPAQFVKMGVTAGIIAGICAAGTWLLVKFVEGFLYLEVSGNLFQYNSFAGNTIHELEFLQNLNLYSDFVLIVAVLLILILEIAAHNRHIS